MPLPVPFLKVCMLLTSLLIAVRAQSTTTTVPSIGSQSDNVIPTTSSTAAFLSQNATSDYCAGPNGEAGVLRRRALSAYPGAPQPSGTKPEVYCSIEQHLTGDQLLPAAATSSPVTTTSIKPQALADVLGNAQNGIQSLAPQTTTSSAVYNPNNLTPAQMSQLLVALQPSSSNAVSSTTQASSLGVESSSISKDRSTADSAPQVSATSGLSATTSSALISDTSGASDVEASGHESGSQSKISKGSVTSVPLIAVSTSVSPLTRTSSSANLEKISPSETLNTAGAQTTPSTTMVSSASISSSGGMTALSGDSVSSVTGSQFIPSGVGSLTLGAPPINSESLPTVPVPTSADTLGQGFASNIAGILEIRSSSYIAQPEGSYVAVGSVTIAQGAPPVTIASTPVSLGNNGVLVAGSSTLLPGPPSSLTAGYVGSGRLVLGTGSGTAPPYALPTGMLPPGHQLPPVVFLTGNSSNNGSTVLPFTGQASGTWDSVGRWRWVVGASTTVAVIAVAFL